MKTLKEYLSEGLLSDIDYQVDKMDDDLKDLIKTPTVKDFTKSVFNNNLHIVHWDISPIIDQYVSKYPNLFNCNKLFPVLRFSLDTTILRRADLNIFLAKEDKPVTKLTLISGWNDSFTGGNLRIYKKIVIDIINKIANDLDLLDVLFSHANKCERQDAIYTYKNTRSLSKIQEYKR